MLCRLQRLPNPVSITSSIITLLKPLKLGQWSDNHRVTAYNVKVRPYYCLKRTRTANCKALYRQMALFWRQTPMLPFTHHLQPATRQRIPICDLSIAYFTKLVTRDRVLYRF